MNKKIWLSVSITVTVLLILISGSLLLNNKPSKKVSKKLSKPYAGVKGAKSIAKQVSPGFAVRRFTDIPNMVNIFSDVIVIGRVEKIIKTDFDQAANDPELKFAHTNYAFNVEKVIMGSAEPTITVGVGGVVVTETTQTYQLYMDGGAEFAPYLYPDKRVLLFLKRAQPTSPAGIIYAPNLPNTYGLPSSQHIYRLDGDMARSALYYKQELPPALAKEYPFLLRDKEMPLDELISRIKGYIASGDTGYGPATKPPYLNPLRPNASTETTSTTGGPQP